MLAFDSTAFDLLLRSPGCHSSASVLLINFAFAEAASFCADVRDQREWSYYIYTTAHFTSSTLNASLRCVPLGKQLTCGFHD